MGLEHPVLQSDATAFAWLKLQRWGPDGETCPFCGQVDHHYFLFSRQVWRCRSPECGKTFSLFSDTKLHSTSLSPRTVALLFFIFQEAAEGISSREVAGLLGLDYRATHLQISKVREALAETVDRTPLMGVVEADACYFNSYVRPPNHGTGTSHATRTASKSSAEDGVAAKDPSPAKAAGEKAPKTVKAVPPADAKGGSDQAPAKDKYVRNPNMHALVAFVERLPEGGIGLVRVAVVRTENQLENLQLVLDFVHGDATVITDEHGSYTPFIAAVGEHKRIRHKSEFVTADGEHSNTVESFFNEMRRSQTGAYHSIGLGYLIYYAHEMAWRLEMRDKPNDVRFADLAQRVLRSGRSKVFADADNKRPKKGKPKVQKPSWFGIAREVPKDQVPVAGAPQRPTLPQHRRRKHHPRSKPRPNAGMGDAKK